MYTHMCIHAYTHNTHTYTHKHTDTNTHTHSTHTNTYSIYIFNTIPLQHICYLHTVQLIQNFFIKLCYKFMNLYETNLRRFIYTLLHDIILTPCTIEYTSSGSGFDKLFCKLCCNYYVRYVACELLHELVHKITHKALHNTLFLYITASVHEQFANLCELQRFMNLVETFSQSTIQSLKVHKEYTLLYNAWSINTPQTSAGHPVQYMQPQQSPTPVHAIHNNGSIT